MTQNQIRLGELKETIRHNQALEQTTRDTNRINEEHYVRADTVSQAQAAELSRHNKEAERQQDVQLVINHNALSEQVRHNKASEEIGWGNIGVGYAQAAASMASANAAGVSAQAAMRNAETAALLAPSQSSLNYAHAQDTLAHTEVNSTQAGLNRVKQGETSANTHLIHARTTEQNYINDIQLPIQTQQSKANLINTYSDSAQNFSKAFDNWSSGFNRTLDIAFKGSRLLK